MPCFLIFFCLLTIFIAQLLCFHVPLFVCPVISSVMKAIPIIRFLAEWMLVVLISRGFMTTILNARNNTPKPILLSQAPLPFTISDDDIQDRDAEAKIENGTALVERKPKRGKKRVKKKKTLEVNYEKRLGCGSHGIAVYEGSLRCGRRVAVKCFPKDLAALANHEISILQKSDNHPNVITYYCSKQSPDYFNIALELCSGSLADFFKNCHVGGDKWDHVANEFDTKRAMKQIATGLMHLHGLGLVHQDINPQNILISSALPSRMLISNFGLCRKLDEDQSSFLPTTNGATSPAGTVGWKAPEMLRGHVKSDEPSASDDSISYRQDPTTTTIGSSSGTTTLITKTHLTKSIDIFSLGCLFYYILTNGKHPYSDQANIIKDNKDLSLIYSDEEGLDLITRMLDPDPLQRPAIETCLVHPFFWNPTKRLSFLQEVSERLERMCKDEDAVLIRLERDAKRVFQHDWRQDLYPRFVEDLRKTRKYDGDSVRDLMRALRNKKSHYQDLPDDVKLELGTMPEGYLEYFASRFPKLLMYVHEVVRDTELHTEPEFRRFFELSET